MIGNMYDKIKSSVFVMINMYDKSKSCNFIYGNKSDFRSRFTGEPQEAGEGRGGGVLLFYSRSS